MYRVGSSRSPRRLWGRLGRTARRRRVRRFVRPGRGSIAGRSGYTAGAHVERTARPRVARGRRRDGGVRGREGRDEENRQGRSAQLSQTKVTRRREEARGAQKRTQGRGRGRTRGEDIHRGR